LTQKSIISKPPPFASVQSLLFHLGLERQLAVEKQTRSNLEQETTSLKKKITLLEYDLQEAKKSLQQTQSSKDKTDIEVSNKFI